MRMKWPSSSGRGVATDPSILTAAAASKALADGTITARELVTQCLARIEAHDRQLNSFIVVLSEEALAAANRADQEIKAGRRRGALHGIPYALKDIYETAGIATTANSRLLQNHVPRSDCDVARRLAEAGAILLGKLNTHEFATGGPSHEMPYPPPRNPWSLEHFTGGSSSGSGAAVAGGLIPLAMGSDTLGSIRGPAS
jgi:aspartyl-tRNA(Asn)/glutamyl-tRNA(Gln) amidotransferase subunit A